MSEEAKVKRYTTHVTGLLVVRPDARSTYNENWTDVFLASDYDILARQLDEARAELAEAKRKIQDHEQGDFTALVKEMATQAGIAAERDALRAAIEAHNKRCDKLVSLESHTRPQYMRIDLPPTDPHNDEVQP